jgi:hypothetical protein
LFRRRIYANHFVQHCLDQREALCKRRPVLEWIIAETKRGRADEDQASEAVMTTFDKREEGFEKQFAHDEALRFKANARRNKLLGLWAAEKLGLSGGEADAYAKEVVTAALEGTGDNDVFRKIRQDFDAKGIAQSDHQIRRTMDELMAKAVADVKASG